MSAEDFALPIPEAVLESKDKDRITELVRIWWAGDNPHMILRPAVTDPKLFGAILAELTWHYANGLEAKHGQQRDEALRAILEGFAAAHTHVREAAESAQ